MTHFGINQRSFPQSKVCALRRNGVRIAPYWCALYTVLLCGLRRIMQNKEFRLRNPEFIDKEIGVAAFPAILRSGLRKMGIQYYLRLEIQP